jgi:hypothetical protein
MEQDKKQSGQTLVALLFIVLVGIIVTVAATIILGINSIATGKLTQGEIARSLAESGAEDSLIQLLRDKSYAVTNKDIPVDLDKATVTVTQGNPIVIDSIGKSGNFNREIKVTVTFDSNGVLTVGGWKEVF